MKATRERPNQFLIHAVRGAQMKLALLIIEYVDRASLCAGKLHQHRLGLGQRLQLRRERLAGGFSRPEAQNRHDTQQFRRSNTLEYGLPISFPALFLA